jgi:excisionase family DNA binding protein
MTSDPEARRPPPRLARDQAPAPAPSPPARTRAPRRNRARTRHHPRTRRHPPTRKTDPAAAMTSTPTAPGHPAPQPPAGPYVTVAELAAATRISRNTIYRLIHAGQIPGTVRITPRTLRIPASAARQLTAPAPHRPRRRAPRTPDPLSHARRIAAALARQIRSGTYHRDNPLPPNAALAARWDTTDSTICAAKQLLAARGILHFRQGRYRIP